MDPPRSLPAGSKRAIDRGAPQRQKPAAAVTASAQPSVAVPLPKPKAKVVLPVPVAGPPRTLEERVKHFSDRLNEYGMNDYADPEEHGDVDDETLMAMSRKFEKDPENFRFLSEKTIKTLAARDEAFEKLREQELIQKGILPESGKRDPIEFEDLIKKQMEMHKMDTSHLPEAMPGQTHGTPPPPPPVGKAKPGTKKYGYETDKSNLMIARDPENDYEPDRLIGSRPRPLGKHNPYELPPFPTSLLSRPELAEDERTAKVLSVLQKYQIRASRAFYYEADIEKFRQDIRKDISDEYKVVRTNQCIMCIYLVFTPLCIHCKFVRRRDKEKSLDCEPDSRLYAWEGYAFTEIMSEEETKRLRLENADVPVTNPDGSGFE